MISLINKYKAKGEPTPITKRRKTMRMIRLERIKKCGANKKFLTYLLIKNILLIEEKLIQFKIHILGISPQISRRFVVRNSTSIFQLHHLLQMIMGWEGYFLHEFRILGSYYGSSYSNDCDVPLSYFNFKEKDKFSYTYNFYEFWEHELRIEKISSLGSSPHYPKVLSGKRSCPLEDIGGAEYYEEAITRQLVWYYENFCLF